jgi:hypothetical protein
MRKRLSRSQRVEAVLSGACAFTRRGPLPLADPKPPRPTSLTQCISPEQWLRWDVDPYAGVPWARYFCSWSARGGYSFDRIRHAMPWMYPVTDPADGLSCRTTVVYDSHCPPQPLSRVTSFVYEVTDCTPFVLTPWGTNRVTTYTYCTF